MPVPAGMGSELRVVQRFQCDVQLIVREVWRRPQPQHLSAIVGPDVLLAYGLLNLPSPRRRDRQKPTNCIVPRAPRQHLHLMLVELAQLRRRELLVFEELEDGRRSIVARKVVGRTRKSRGPWTIRNTTTCR